MFTDRFRTASVLKSLKKAIMRRTKLVQIRFARFPKSFAIIFKSLDCPIEMVILGLFIHLCYEISLSSISIQIFRALAFTVFIPKLSSPHYGLFKAFVHVWFLITPDTFALHRCMLIKYSCKCGLKNFITRKIVVKM